MSRKDDLEGHIRESYEIIREYEAMLRTSDRPEEKLRARRSIDDQWALIEGYLGEYQRLAGGAWPQDIAEIAARFEPGGARASSAAPAGGLASAGTGGAILFHQDRQNVGQQINVAGDYYAGGAPPGSGPARGERPGGSDGAPGAANAGWRRETLRQLLLAAFRDQDLMAFCFDHFEAVYVDLPADMGTREKVHRLLEYCVRYGQVDRLLGLVRERNPVQYERFRPRAGGGR
jgi:hypothetical protein